jgi:hypothetical protein
MSLATSKFTSTLMITSNLTCQVLADFTVWYFTKDMNSVFHFGTIGVFFVHLNECSASLCRPLYYNLKTEAD